MPARPRRAAGRLPAPPAEQRRPARAGDRVQLSPWPPRARATDLAMMLPKSIGSIAYSRRGRGDRRSLRRSHKRCRATARRQVPSCQRKGITGTMSHHKGFVDMKGGWQAMQARAFAARAEGYARDERTGPAAGLLAALIDLFTVAGEGENADAEVVRAAWERLTRR